MTEKRFIESATQNVDDGEINYSVYDMKNREYLKMSDEKTTKNLCNLLNDLHEENTHLEKDNKRMVKFLLSEGYTLKDYLKFIEEG